MEWNKATGAVVHYQSYEYQKAVGVGGSGATLLLKMNGRFKAFAPDNEKLEEIILVSEDGRAALFEVVRDPLLQGPVVDPYPYFNGESYGSGKMHSLPCRLVRVFGHIQELTDIIRADPQLNTSLRGQLSTLDSLYGNVIYFVA